MLSNECFPTYCSPNVKTCIRNFTLMYVVLYTKVDNLRVICASQNPGFQFCVCIVATWLNSEVNDSEICIQGYSIV